MRTKILLISLCIVTFLNASAQKRIAGRSLTKVYNNISFVESSSRIKTDTLFSFSTPGTLPNGICWDGSYFWHCDTTKYIYKLNSSGEVLDSIYNPDAKSKYRGGGMTFDGNNIWLVGEESAKLYQINKEGTILKNFDLPSKIDSDPNGFGIAWDGNCLWHSQYSPSVIYNINPSDGSVINSFVPANTIMGIEWINNKLYGINPTQDINISKLVEIDTKTGKFNDSIDWTIPYPLDLCWDNSHIWNVSGPAKFFDIQIGGKMKIYKVETSLIQTSITNKVYTFDDIKLYPNPFTSNIIIESNLGGNMEITNSVGQIIYSRDLYNQIENIDLSFLNSGLYFVKINNKTSKLLKTK